MKTTSTARLEALDVERVVVVEELQQVEAGQVAGRVVEVHVLRARVRAVDAAGGVRGVPAVDRGVELQAGVGALPGGLGDLAEQVAGRDRLDDLEPSVTARRCQSASASTASMNSSVTRTELLAFWYWMENESAPSRSMSKPASRSTRALRSSFDLHQMNSSTSGWSTLRMTILAARRVLPPALMVPAEASAPRMKLTGPEAVPPPFSSSTTGADARQVHAGARAALEDDALLPVPVEDRVHRVVDGEDEAGAGLLRARPSRRC